MKTLYERLSEKRKEFLKEYEIKHPNVSQTIMYALKLNTNYAAVNLGDALFIFWAFYDNKPFDYDKYTELFDEK